MADNSREYRFYGIFTVYLHRFLSEITGWELTTQLKGLYAINPDGENCLRLPASLDLQRHCWGSVLLLCLG